MAQSPALLHSRDESDSVYQTGWYYQVWRLVLWNLFLQSRRLQSKILAALFLGGYVVCMIFVIISHVLLGGSVPRTQDPILAAVFPSSLQFNLGYLALLGPLFICIIAGTLVGSEYGYGMHQQLLTRGLTRAQVLTAQVVALALISLGLVAFTILLSLLVGYIVGPLSGFFPSSLPLSGWLGIVLAWLTQSLRYFLYMLIAVFAATAGRSVLAGVGFSLGYIFVEFLATTLLFNLIGGLSARVGTFIANFINCLPGIVSNSLNSYTTAMIAGQQPPPLGQLPLYLLTTLGYCIVLLGASYALYIHSDIFD